MGLTIVHKSDLTTRKKNPRIALVLAGGAVTGGAYKLGGLKALDDFLVNRKTTDFDIYVGLSAGSVLAAPLAGGVSPAEMLRSLEGVSEEFTELRAKDFYGLTPDHTAYCKELWEKNGMYTQGPYTPPGLDGYMVTFPSTLGGGNWNGLSYDRGRGLVFTSVMNLGQVARMVQGVPRGG